MINKFEFTFRFFAIACLTFTFSAFAAAAPQVYVSYKGNDANTCDRNAPCATFAVAVNQVDAGGEVIVLDSGNYGAVTITKAMQIIAPTGVVAGVSGYGNPLVVAAGASDTVVLRGLTLKGGTYNIEYTSGAALHIENCVISNGYSRGIRSTAPGKLFIKDTVVRNNYVGIEIYTSSGLTQAVIDNSLIENSANVGVLIYNNAQVSVNNSISSGNYDGFYVYANGKLTASGSTASGNTRYGFAALSGASPVVVIDDCTAANNGDAGIYNGGGGLPTGVYTRVSNSVSTGNKYGFYNLGFFESYGNNRVRGNTTNTYGTITSVSQN